jgi:hypothetical protein
MRRALIGSAVLFSVACMANDDLTGSSTVNGSYVLRTINGSELPYAISGSGANRVEMLDDVINFYEGGTFSENGHKRTVVNGQATDTPITESGTYQLLGTSVTMKASDGTHERRPQINANTMTFVEAGITMTFRK